MRENMGDLRAGRPTFPASLRALAADDAADGASAAVQIRLLGEVRQLRRARRRSIMKMSLLATALCIAIAVPIGHLATHDIQSGSSSSASQHVPALANGEMVTAFFPLRYSTIPVSGGRLVRLEVPRHAVRAFGVETTESTLERASSTILADVFVGDDGLARAVRFVRPLTRKRQLETQQ